MHLITQMDASEPPLRPVVPGQCDCVTFFHADQHRAIRFILIISKAIRLMVKGNSDQHRAIRLILINTGQLGLTRGLGL